MIFELETIGDPDDGMVSVYTGCVDGNGKKVIAVINMKNARNNKTNVRDVICPTCHGMGWTPNIFEKKIKSIVCFVTEQANYSRRKKKQ